MSAEVSIIVTSRDEDPAILQATLDGLRATTRGVAIEIIVIDDGSSTPVVCEGPGVSLVRNSHPMGVCGSRRLGAELAGAKVLAWVDAHMSFGEYWLEQMLVHTSSGALLCSPFWDYDLQTCLCWGADFVWNSTRNYMEQKVPGFGLQHRVMPVRELAPEVPMVIGACYMMRRDSYERMGGFSPLFRTWGIDEQDLSARAWISGAGVRCVTSAKVGHLSRTAFPYPVSFDHIEFNQIVMLRTLFEPQTVRKLEHCFEPLPKQVRSWLSSTGLASWRNMVQATRRLSDRQFFSRFLPGLAEELDLRAA
ncbi:MAG: glycosyltransferase [Bryobacteraceae bacterium]|nr:glycosyltransferase [Bryobacterales bacterium]MEB2364063.1 glycosyltransferase [Bryobacterales bacterium]NUN00617.1 glycosyltransferase [Bryobacteraceae bacterium]